MVDDDKLMDLLAEVFRTDKASITDDMAYNGTPKWDSLAQMELIAAIESTYELELSAGEILEIKSVGRLKNLINRKTQAAGRDRPPYREAKVCRIAIECGISRSLIQAICTRLRQVSGANLACSCMRHFR